MTNLLLLVALALVCVLQDRRPLITGLAMFMGFCIGMIASKEFDKRQ